MLGSSLLFALAHGTQNLPLFVDRFGFGMIAAFLVVAHRGARGGHRMAHREQLRSTLLRRLDRPAQRGTRRSPALGGRPWPADLVQLAIFALAVLWLATASADPTADGRTAASAGRLMCERHGVPRMAPGGSAFWSGVAASGIVVRGFAEQQAPWGMG